MAKYALIYPYYDVTQKIKSKISNFFLIEITRLSAFSEGLNSSPTLAAGELWPNMSLTQMWLLRALWGFKYRNGGALLEFYCRNVYFDFRPQVLFYSDATDGRLV